MTFVQSCSEKRFMRDLESRGSKMLTTGLKMETEHKGEQKTYIKSMITWERRTRGLLK
jgi:hypothetical protein